MNAYVWLLIWEGLAAGCAFWIQPAGWLWFLAAVLLTVLVEWLTARYAKSQGITDHGKLFEPVKYDHGALVFFQAAYALTLSVIIGCVLSLQNQWVLFGILAAGTVICLAGSAWTLRHGQDA